MISRSKTECCASTRPWKRLIRKTTWCTRNGFRRKGGGKKAVVLLPHWNAPADGHNALCRGLARLGVSALRLSLPYHDYRMPPELQRADYAVSANVCRTIDAARQAVIDVRCCLDWLECKASSAWASSAPAWDLLTRAWPARTTRASR